MFPGKDKKILRQSKINRLLNDNSNNITVLEFSTIINRNFDINNITKADHIWIKKELESKIINTLFYYLSDKSEIRTINLNNKKSNYQISEYISNIVVHNNTNLITNGNVVSIFQNLKKFRMNFKNSNNFLINYGSLNSCDIYYNVFLRWDENKILVFDKKDFYDFSDYELEYYSSPSIYDSVIAKSKLYIDESILKSVKIYEIKDENGII